MPALALIAPYRKLPSPLTSGRAGYGLWLPLQAAKFPYPAQIDRRLGKNVGASN